MTAIVPAGPVRSLPLALWPAADRDAWAKAFEAGGLFEPKGRGVHLAPTTHAMLEKNYGRWLGFLDETGYLDPLVSPVDRVTLERVVAFVDRHQGRVLDSTVMIYLHVLRWALTLLAPDDDWSWIAKLRRRYGAAHKTKRDKRDRLVEASALYRLGADLMKSALENPEPRVERRHIRYRDGLTIALLIACPVRLKNLTAIRIGIHLVRAGTHYRLRFEAHETKGRRPLNLPVPEALSPWIERYLSDIRPHLLGPRDHDVLWLTTDGTPVSASTLRHQIKARTRKAFGKHVNPHLFRDCAATSIAELDPEHVRIAQDVLGHASFKTTEHYYQHSRQSKASARYQGEIRSLKRELGVRKDHP